MATRRRRRPSGRGQQRCGLSRERLGKIVIKGALLDYLARSLLDHPAAAGDGPAPAPGGNVAPEQQRVQHRNQADEQQNNPEGIDVDPGVGGLHGKGQDGAEHYQKDADPDAHPPPSFQAPNGAASLPVAVRPSCTVRPQSGPGRYQRTACRALLAGPAAAVSWPGSAMAPAVLAGWHAAWRRSTFDLFCLGTSDGP